MSDALADREPTPPDALRREESRAIGRVVERTPRATTDRHRDLEERITDAATYEEADLADASPWLLELIARDIDAE